MPIQRSYSTHCPLSLIITGSLAHQDCSSKFRSRSKTGHKKEWSWHKVCAGECLKRSQGAYRSTCNPYCYQMWSMRCHENTELKLRMWWRKDNLAHLLKLSYLLLHPAMNFHDDGKLICITDCSNHSLGKPGIHISWDSILSYCKLCLGEEQVGECVSLWESSMRLWSMWSLG